MRLLAFLALLGLGACMSAGSEPACAGCLSVKGAPALPSGFLPWAEDFQGDLTFVVGDAVSITLPFYDDEDSQVQVAPDGNIYLSLVGRVPAVGRTAPELEADLERRYARFLRFPEVGVIPDGFESRQVFVGGEVAEPGAFKLSGPTGVLEAVYQAGGFRPTADRSQVVLIRRGPDRRPMLKVLDLKRFARNAAANENTLLRPFDIVVVPRSGIAMLNLFVAQYIEGIVPFNQNFNYTVLDVGSGNE